MRGAAIQLAETGVEVASQRPDVQAWMAPPDLSGAAQARSADHRARRQLVERAETGTDEGVARILAAQHRGEREGLRQLHRHVLERVHGEVGAPVEQRHLQLLGEQALAADLVERAVEHPVALGGHAEDLDLAAGVGIAQPLLHVQGLPHRETALARGDDEALRGGERGDGGWIGSQEKASGKVGGKRARSRFSRRDS